MKESGISGSWIFFHEYTSSERRGWEEGRSCLFAKSRPYSSMASIEIMKTAQDNCRPPALLLRKLILISSNAQDLIFSTFLYRVLCFSGTHESREEWNRLRWEEKYFEDQGERVCGEDGGQRKGGGTKFFSRWWETEQGSALPWSLAQRPQLFARKELGVGKEAESFKLDLGNMTDPCAREHL